MLSDNLILNAKNDVFKKLYTQMVKMTHRAHNVKLFIIDNLMTLTKGYEGKLLAEQKNIAMMLKDFAEKYKVHVILIAHPRGGDGNQRISGAQEIQNICDTIIRYVRLGDEEKKMFKGTEYEKFLHRISAYIKFEKVRDDGTSKSAALEWDNKIGAVYNLSFDQEAINYEQDGYWTRHIKKYSEEDRPPPHPHYSDR
jgi:hypothetical protein